MSKQIKSPFLDRLVELRDGLKLTWKEIAEQIQTEDTPNALRKMYYRYVRAEHKPKAHKTVKVLLLDIETAPMLGYVWGLWDNNIALNQLHTDWYILSWSAKWLGDSPDKVMYKDQRNAKNIEDDSVILKEIWNLLDEADVVIHQNGTKFDIRKLNARFIQHGFPPPASFRQIDTLKIAKKHFGFTSNKLEYMTDKLCTKYKKLKHSDFSGFELWKECLAGNKKAWDSMKKYNMYDVLSLEELYNKLKVWDKTINFNVYHDHFNIICKCGSIDFKQKGHVFTNSGKFKRFICNSCGAEMVDKENLLSLEKRKSLGK